MKIFGMDPVHWRRLFQDPQWVGIAAKRILDRVNRKESILTKASGVIHVGANVGEERDFYDNFDLNVIFIEPIPSIFSQLQENIQSYPKQRAYKYLFSNKDDADVVFNISNNGGLSSSMLDLNLHKDIWPEVDFVERVTMKTTRFDTFIRNEEIDLKKYDVLVMDTQGTEMLVLEGAGDLLNRFSYIQTEAADFEIYKDCAKLEDIERFLLLKGFKEFSREKFAVRANGGVCYNITYRNIRSG